MNLKRALWPCEAPHSIIWFLGSTVFALKQPPHILVLTHQSIVLNKIAICSFHTCINQWSINPLQWSSAPSQHNPAPDPLLSSSTPLCLSCYYAWGSRKNPSPPSVWVSDTASEWACAIDLSHSIWNPVYAPYCIWAVQFKNQTHFSLLETTTSRGI